MIKFLAALGDFIYNSMQTIVLLIILGALLGILNQMQVVMINVEIYSTGDPPELIYCATGTLAPPAVYLGSGQIAKGQESYC